MTDEEQIAADFAPGFHDVPADVLSYTPLAPLDDTFDESQRFLHGEGSEAQMQMAGVQAAQDRIRNWLSTFHGPDSENTNNLRRQVDSGKISSADYFAMTGRIYAGGTGHSATRNARGNITGYTAADGTALGGASATPGLDALHGMQGTPVGSNGALSDGFSPLPSSPLSMPRSVAARVGPPSPGMDLAASTLTYDTRLTATPEETLWGRTGDHRPSNERTKVSMPWSPASGIPGVSRTTQHPLVPTSVWR